MKVIVDSQILIQALYNRSSWIRNLLFLSEEPEMELLDDWILHEIQKFQYSKKNRNGPSFDQAAPALKSLGFSRIETPSLEELEDYPSMREAKDQPIPASAIKHDVNIIISQDKNFLVGSENIKKPKIVSSHTIPEKRQHHIPF